MRTGVYSGTRLRAARTVRHKGIWLKPKHLMRLFTSKKLHAHTADACVQSFFASLESWRERKKAGDPDAHPPRKRKWYFKVEYKRSAMKLADGKLRLSNGKGNDPLVLEWPSHELRNEIRRADGRAQRASVKRNGSWSFKNCPASATGRHNRLRQEKYNKHIMQGKQNGVEKRA